LLIQNIFRYGLAIELILIITNFGYIPHFTETWGYWIQPTYNGQGVAAIWNGIGLTSLVQAGATSGSKNHLSGLPDNYEFWVEDYPNRLIYLAAENVSTPLINGGDQLFVSTSYLGGSPPKASAFLMNVTTGSYTVYQFDCPDYNPSQSANFIYEAIGAPALFPYPYWGQTSFSGSYALWNDGNGNNYFAKLGDLGYTKVIMRDSNGNLKAVPSDINDNTFTVATCGLLHVQIVPAVPTIIMLDGSPRGCWGLTYVKLQPGNYTLSFTDVAGYLKPNSVSISQNGGAYVNQSLTTPISIIAGQTTDVIANWTQLGNMHVTTTPAVPATIFCNGVPREDWGLWTYFPSGSYTVSFGNLNGFNTPGSQVAVVSAGTTTNVNGNYTVNSTATYPYVPHGLLHVQTSPAVPSMISVNGYACDTWGLTYVELPPGAYILSFSDVAGFKTPTQVSVSQNGSTPVIQPLTIPITITDTVITDVMATFSAQGNLRVETSPAVPATLFCNGLPIDDWGFWTNIDPGIYTLSFGDVPGFKTPASINVQVIASSTTHVIADYSTGVAQQVYP
jgi:hypothetical protein